MSLKDDLIAAKKLIDTPEKWAKDPVGLSPACAYGAVHVATGREPHFSDRFRACVKALRASLPDGFRNVEDYNDHPDTSHSDMMVLFSDAIANAEKADA